MRLARLVLLLALAAPIAAPAAGLKTCLAAGDLAACYGRIADACIEALPPPAADAPMNQWKEDDHQCWAQEHAAWDALLNESYRALKQAVARLDPAAPDALRDAQRAWIALRDADCAWPATFLRQNALHHHDISCAVRATAARAVFLMEEADQWRDW